MKIAFNLASYGVQEMTIAEAREVTGGDIHIARLGAAIGEFIGRLYVAAYEKGMREACSCCN